VAVIKLVSVIVPVYGVEEYLAECVDSLLAQTYENLEILLIDDGGKDRSGEICDRYAERDDRIKVIHKTNGGAASARNVGIDVASGEFICFVDGDDLVEPDYVSHLWNTLSVTDADISVCGLYYMTKCNKRSVQIECVGVFDSTAYLKLFTDYWTCALMTNKLFKRTTIGSVRFEEGHCIDDEFFTYQVVMNSQKVAVTDAPLYAYRMRGSSVMHDAGGNGQRMILDRIEYTTLRYQNVSQRYPELEQIFFRDMVDSMTRYWRCSYEMPKVRAQVRSWANKHVRKMLKLQIPLKMRLVYLYQLYCKKPKAIPLVDAGEMDLSEYFD
jgi:glycosyltransferase involved in cell wall biosynthesis